MALELVTGPAREPVTLDEAKAHLRLEIPDDDGLLAGYLIAAREYIEGQIKRDLVTKTWDYMIDWAWPIRGHSCTGWRQFIRMPLNPVQSVTFLKYVDEAGVTQTIDPSKYTVASRTNYSFIAPAYDVTWNATRRVPEAITVRFVSGYTECPQDLKAALMLLAGHFYENRESVSGKAMHEVPMSVDAMIAPYTDRSL